MSENKPIQLGLCCLNTVLRAQNPTVFSSRKMVVKSVKEKGIDALKEKIIQNLKDTLVLIDYNEANGIKVFRLSSELFPHKSNPKVEDYDFDFAKDLLRQIGEKARKYNQRITFHPGQYNVLGSPNKSAIEHSICDLDYHATVLDLMGMGDDSVMVIHGGGTYGNKKEAMERWCETYLSLPNHIKKRLVLENCEKCFSIKDCLKISKKVKVPVVFDTHHFECYKILHPNEFFYKPEAYIPLILHTWKRRNIKPKFHVSEQGTGRCGHHSDYIEVMPEYLLEIPAKFNTHIDIMIEAKMKEQAIFKLYEKYPALNCKIHKA
jgi:UV DNA damage endonuclease